MEEEIKIETDKKTGTLPVAKPSTVKLTRTYQSDIQSAVKSGKGSLINIVMKEQEKKKVYEERTSIKSGKNIFVLIFSFFLIISGVGVVSYFLYMKVSQKTAIVSQIEAPSFIYSNSQVKIYFDPLNRKNTIEKIKKEQNNNTESLGSITQLSFIKKDDVIESIINTSDILTSVLDTRVPRDFLRFLENDFMFGLHSSSFGNEPFFIFKINSYEYAFANMLTWEENLEDDFSPIFAPDPTLRTETRRLFKDLIIENRDVRAIVDDQGKILFAYSFLDKNYLVFVNNENTLREIFLRLETSKLEKK